MKTIPPSFGSKNFEFFSKKTFSRSITNRNLTFGQKVSDNSKFRPPTPPQGSNTGHNIVAISGVSAKKNSAKFVRNQKPCFRSFSFSEKGCAMTPFSRSFFIIMSIKEKISFFPASGVSRNFFALLCR